MLSIISRQWDCVVTKLRARTTPQSYDSCLSRIKLIGWEQNVLVIGVPTRYIKLYIERFFLDLIRQSVAETLAPDATGATPNDIKISIKIDGDLYGEFRKGMEASRMSETAVQTAPCASVPYIAPAKPPAVPAQDAFPLSSFRFGQTNQAAKNACDAVLDDNDRRINPLAFYGAHGVGKTHLIRGLYSEFKARSSQRPVVYRSTEAYVNSFFSALKTKNVEAHRERYRDLDVLILDDLQYLSGKTHAQDDFLFMTDSLLEKGARLIVSADSPVSALRLDQRIIDRLSAGVVVELKAPDVDARLDMIDALALDARLCMDPSARAFLSEQAGMSGRALVGLFKTLSLRARTLDGAASLELVKELVGSNASGDDRQELSDPDAIMKRVCEKYGVTEKDLRSSNRRARASSVRKIAVWLMNRYCDLSLSEIGRRLGGRSHAAISYLITSLDKELSSNDALQREMRQLRKDIRDDRR